MYEVSGMRLLRVLNGTSLSKVATAVSCQRSYLSEVERTLDAGKKLQRKLSDYYGAPWSLLCLTIDASKIADSIIANATKKGPKNG